MLHRRYARVILGLAVPDARPRRCRGSRAGTFSSPCGGTPGASTPRGAPSRGWVLQIAHFPAPERAPPPEPASPRSRPIPMVWCSRGSPAPSPDPPKRAGNDSASPSSSRRWEAPPSCGSARPLIWPSSTTSRTRRSPPSSAYRWGTAKTRIRGRPPEASAGALGSQWAALATLCLLGTLGVRYWTEHTTLARYDRALSMVTRERQREPPAGTGSRDAGRNPTRANRSRPGAGIAVVTLVGVPRPHRPARPTRCGCSTEPRGPRSVRSSRTLVEAPVSSAEDPALAVLPDRLEVTREPRNGSATPSARVNRRLGTVKRSTSPSRAPTRYSQGDGDGGPPPTSGGPASARLGDPRDRPAAGPKDPRGRRGPRPHHPPHAGARD